MRLKLIIGLVCIPELEDWTVASAIISDKLWQTIRQARRAASEIPSCTAIDISNHDAMPFHHGDLELHRAWPFVEEFDLIDEVDDGPVRLPDDFEFPADVSPSPPSVLRELTVTDAGVYWTFWPVKEGDPVETRLVTFEYLAEAFGEPLHAFI